MRSVCIIQARMGSRRFPGKVLQDLCGRPVLAHVVERCQAIPGIDQVVLTIPRGVEDDPLERWATAHGIMAYRNQVPLHGTEANDCLRAYAETSEATHAEVVVRVTGDEPLLCPVIAGLVLAPMLAGHQSIVSNVHPRRTYPDGLDIEAIDAAYLRNMYEWSQEYPSLGDREHATQCMQRHWGAATWNISQGEDLSAVRWTVDVLADLEKLRRIVAHLPAGAFTLADTRKAAEEAGCWP